MTRELDADAPGGNHAAQSPLRILLVEDNVDAAESMRLLLELRGVMVDVAHDGEQAMKFFRRRSNDLVLMDLNLTDTDGFKLVALMLAEQRQPTTRFISVSGLSDIEDEERARAAGFELHLVKPVDPSRLYALCDQVLRSRKHENRPSAG